MRFKTILADPPWQYKNERTGFQMESSAVQKYPVISLEKLKTFPINELVDKDCILWLWATVPLLPEALELMKAWGFKYKTAIFWRKIMSLGMGFWFRGQVEMLLLGIKGKIKAFRYQRANFLQTKVRAHSEKPIEIYALIEPVSPKPRLELFARRKRIGWYCWGNEIESDIEINFKGE